MSTILITGPSRSGKTSLADALLTRLREAGRSAAYVKPFSPTPGDDADYRFASEVLAGALGITAGPTPHPLSDGVDEAAAAVSDLRSQHDTVIIEAADGSPATQTLAEAVRRTSALEIHALHPIGQNWAHIADRAAVNWGNRLAALVVNAVPPYKQDAVTASASESSAGVNTVVIPESRAMLAPTVAQVAAHLGASWVQDPVNADAPVEHFLIGGNIMDNGPTYYGRYPNQAVITRAQRPDIQLASMLAQTRCLVLTGPGEATNYVRAEALERDIPLLQVSTSTIDTADALDRLIDAVTPHSLAKARNFAALLQRHAGAETVDVWLA